jgi:hypothetical protein
MPVLLLWAVPAVIVVGGVGYYLVRAGPITGGEEEARTGRLAGLFFTPVGPKGTTRDNRATGHH